MRLCKPPCRRLAFKALLCLSASAIGLLLLLLLLLLLREPPRQCALRKDFCAKFSRWASQ